MQNNKHLLAFSINAYYNRLKFWIWMRIEYLKYQIEIQMKIWSRNLDQLNFRLR